MFPFTLFPVCYNLNYNGCVSLWKGCFSVAAYYGIKLIFESVLSEVTSFEKNIEEMNKPEKIYGHTTLKMYLSIAWEYYLLIYLVLFFKSRISNCLTTPIYSAVIFESVQSGISYENLGLMDLLKETWNRITGYKYNYRTRLIPIWSLVVPTGVYFTAHHFLAFGFENVLYSSIKLFTQLLDDKVFIKDTF